MGAGRICPSGLISPFLVSSYSLEALVASTVFLHKSQNVSCSARDPLIPPWGPWGTWHTGGARFWPQVRTPKWGQCVCVCVCEWGTPAPRPRKDDLLRLLAPLFPVPTHCWNIPRDRVLCNAQLIQQTLIVGLCSALLGEFLHSLCFRLLAGNTEVIFCTLLP